jgi:predicted GH43/DUF377 family glycosyl hydrolase
MRLTSTFLRTTCLALCILLFEAGSKPGLAQTNFYKYKGNPVLEKGEPGTWDDQRIQGLSVLFDGTIYHLWYRGSNAIGNNAIGYATSLDGIAWEKYADNPVLETGSPGSWDELNLQMGHVIFEENMYKMWYDGNGSFGWAIGLATSSDGIQWTKDTLNNPVLTTGVPGSWDDWAVWGLHIIHDDTTYKMWYTGIEDRSDIGFFFRRIGYAESPDGFNWTKHPEPVLEQGDYLTWGYDFETPMVIYDGVNYNMWYSIINTDSDCCYQVDYAVSTDGIHWTKDSLNNPALESGEPGSWHTSTWYPYVIENDNLYRMWFSGSGGFGYAEDFSRFVHSDSVIVEDVYADPSAEPLHVLGRIINPEGHNLSAKAIFVSDGGSVRDSVTILDDGVNDDGEAGNGIHGGYWDVSGEKNYTVGIKTVDLETGFTRNGLNWFITDRFTTKGPVVVDSLLFYNPDADTEPNPGDQIRYDLKLLNEGETDTIYNVSINVLHISGYTQKYGFGSPVFGNLAPGESKKGSRNYGIAFSDSCPAPANIPFGVQIVSESDTFWTDTFYVFVDTILTAIEHEINIIPEQFSLKQNYPNPFNPSTIIGWQLPVTGDVELTIYNVLGEKVIILVSEKQNTGYHQYEWDAGHLPSGVYYYKIKSGEYIAVKKMVLIK